MSQVYGVVDVRHQTHRIQNSLWKAVSKRCAFGARIHWFRVEGRPIRIKKDVVSKVSGFVFWWIYYFALVHWITDIIVDDCLSACRGKVICPGGDRCANNPCKPGFVCQPCCDCFTFQCNKHWREISLILTVTRSFAQSFFVHYLQPLW